ncbi:DHA2 family efflux MFS transporter permease subunit [Candidatus Entotheonella palauensis]|uniref:DHA2 family efflux MFS transporter permease subunit n=1 Tax=Candidatus Entotheonella palauensis TaxID=93172 RepID=UPI000B7F8A08|nr:DHA2 family efflux MFS transporter permease subunit [Candidatus Entotheonella palauensis]
MLSEKEPTIQQTDIAVAPPTHRPMFIAGVMGCCMLGPFINILDTNVVNVALPRMMSGLGTDILTIRWVVTAYLIATAVTMPAIGWIGRMLGNQRLYAIGLSVFTSASALCGMAPSVEFLILFRIIQGLGAGVLMPISWALMIQVSPPEQRGMATSIWAIGASLGSLAGLPIGGYFADAVDWRAVFFVNFIPGSLAVLGTILLVPASEREERVPFDGWGFLTLSIALISLLVALSQVQQEGWNSPFILTLLALCGLAVPVFLIIESYSANPLIDLSLYKRLLYASGTMVSIIMGVFFYASSFLVILFAQLVLDYSVQQSALMLIPGSVVMIIAAYSAGWLVDRFEPRLAMMLGLFGFCACCYLMVLADRRMTAIFIAWVYIWRGFGLGFLNAPVFAVATSGLEPHRARMASSLLSLSLVLGGTFGISLLATLMERWQTIHQSRFAEAQMLTSIGTQQALGTFTDIAQGLGLGPGAAGLYAQGRLSAMLGREALVHALNDCFAFVLVLAIGCVGLVLMMRMVRPPRQ